MWGLPPIFSSEAFNHFLGKKFLMAPRSFRMPATVPWEFFRWFSATEWTLPFTKADWGEQSGPLIPQWADLSFGGLTAKLGPHLPSVKSPRAAAPHLSSGGTSLSYPLCKVVGVLDALYTCEPGLSQQPCLLLSLVKFQSFRFLDPIPTAGVLPTQHQAVLNTSRVIKNELHSTQF